MSKMHGRENEKVNGVAREAGLCHTVEVVDQTKKSKVALREEAVLAFWQEHNIFKKSVEAPAGNAPVGDFVFYDGPPFATGLPHYGHLLAGTIKDAVPRFWTMNGYRVRRQWGWDCHGLPLENLIEKELGLATKKDIEEYGVKKFNEKARSAVLRYADDWRRIVPRMGRFVDMKNDYRTMDSTYTESVWWAFKSLHEKGLVNEGFKSMHLCPRCGTTLSNFEVNQGYKDIKDIAVTVKLPLLDDYGKPTDTSLLVWTTTPWTLPGNLAAAVHNEHEYVKVEVATESGIEKVILAKGRITQLGEVEHTVIESMTGADLVGTKYQPPFAYLQDQDMEGKENAWKIYHADYVEIGEEGTGAVHLAPAFGEDDMKLAEKHGVPIFHHVDEGGHFKEFVTDFAGQLVKPKDDDASGVDHKDADIQILKHLQATGAIFKKENITHSYPHCWRCDTPLLNYATTSWFVDVPSLKDKLIEENNQVNWVPGHVGKNRFGKWLEGARDWAISRQRYWGAPLPIWKNPETGKAIVIGSLDELKQYVPKSGNTYHTLRHGESTKNVEPKVVTNKWDAPHPLTEKGIADTKLTASELKGKVDVIITSPVLRAKETAQLVADELGLAPEEVVVDERIREIEHGTYEGALMKDFHAEYPDDLTRFESKPENGESWGEVKSRMGECLYSLESEYKGKNILIVSHGDPLALLRGLAKNYSKEQIVSNWFEEYPVKGSAETLEFVPVPHNDNYELDFHRPYIDEIDLFEDGVKLERIPDVFDCWFESGSMPYAQHHYPFENSEDFNKERYPANFIAEGLDQTRGWFYSLLVLGTALFDKAPFKNVIVNGTVLAEDGKKMSKSLQNYPDPMLIADTTGVDAMRFYLLSSPVMKGEDFNFIEKDVQELQRKNLGRLHNVLAMYEMFADGTTTVDDSDHVLDKWIITRLNQVITEATDGYKKYELDKATRPLTDFIDDVSVWYLRRSRDRLKGTDEADKKLALGTLRYVLKTTALVMAPVMPFYAEHLWQAVKEEDDAESVHLAKWPEGGDVDNELLEKMRQTRELVTAALELRTKAAIKVRQPISSVGGQTLGAELETLVLEELNAKEYVVSEKPSIDTNLTDILLAEGAVRELMRAVQGKRKTEGLEPDDRIVLTIGTSESGEKAIADNEALLINTVGASKLNFEEVEEEIVTTGEYQFSFTIKKI